MAVYWTCWLGCGRGNVQNNLDELWSLCNFVLPHVFTSLALFQTWFNFDRLTESGSWMLCGRVSVRCWSACHCTDGTWCLVFD